MKNLLFALLIAGLIPSMAFAEKFSSRYASLTNSTVTANSTSLKIDKVDQFTVYFTKQMGTTPTITSIVQVSPDGTNWFTFDSRTETTASTTLRHVVSGASVAGKYVRARVEGVRRATCNATIYLGTNQ